MKSANNACPSRTFSPAENAKTFWLETELFPEKGGWVVDAQFMDLMGSPYLMAHGMGKPVANAKTNICVPEKTEFRLWVRTRDWYPDSHPGLFQILLGSKTSPIFGNDGNGDWHWVDGGKYSLDGDTSVELRDLSGYNGRCDVLCLTSDLDFIPPEPIAEIQALRERFGGVSSQIHEPPAYDVVIVGGGLAGCTAAVAACRNGCRVALVQNRPVLGGNASSEILVPPVGVWPHGRQNPFNPRETGLLEEYRTAGNQRVSEGKLYEKRLHRLLELETNLDLFLNTQATGVKMASGDTKRIAAILAQEITTGKRLRLSSTFCIDSSGDSLVGVAAGADFRTGKEPASLHREPWAPDEYCPHTMGNGIKYATRDLGEDTPFVAPDWAISFPTCDSFGPRRHPPFDVGEAIGYQWQNEMGGLRDTYADAEEIRDELFRLTLGIWDHVKNHCDKFSKKARTHAMTWLGYVAGKRENRRLLGDYVLTQNDIAKQTLFPDRVAYGAWVVDDHHSEGFFCDGSFGKHEDDHENAHLGVEFSIPFRSLYSRNVKNLLLAGRNISATHLAMSDTRVMLTCALMGHAVGTGAALCLQAGLDPAEFCQTNIGDLQLQLQREGAYIPNLRMLDSDDLAPTANLSASSERELENGETMKAEQVCNGWQRADDSSRNAWASQDGDGEPWLELRWTEEICFNVFQLAFQTPALRSKNFRLEIEKNGQWQPLFDVSQNQHRRHVLGFAEQKTRALRLFVEATAVVSEIHVYHESETAVASIRRSWENMRKPDEGPFLPFQVDNPIPKNLTGIVLLASEVDASERFWLRSSWGSDFIGHEHLHDGNANKGLLELTFAPKVPQAGCYEIRLAYVACENRASNTLVRVLAQGGTQTFRIDQRQTPPIDDIFLSLGVFQLTENSTVVVSNRDSDGYVSINALQVIPREQS